MASSKKLKRITIHMDGQGEDHEGFHVEHEYHQSGDGHYEQPKNMGAMSSHGELMDHVHEHVSKHGGADCPCGMCGEGGDEETSKNMTRHGYEKKSPNDPHSKSNGGHSAKHPGFKAVAAKISSKEHLSSKAAGAILAARTRGASAGAHKANPRLNRVK